MRYEIRLSGAGGQGLITAGILLARAAILREGVNAAQTQSYGPEARGGASKAEVIISKQEINFIKVEKPTVILALTQEAVDKFTQDATKDTIVIVDNMLVKEMPEVAYKLYRLPIIAGTEELNAPLAANIISLGALNTIIPVVDDIDLKKVIADAFPARATEINSKAYDLGVSFAKKELQKI